MLNWSVCLQVSTLLANLQTQVNSWLCRHPLPIRIMSLFLHSMSNSLYRLCLIPWHSSCRWWHQVFEFKCLYIRSSIMNHRHICLYLSAFITTTDSAKQHFFYYIFMSFKTHCGIYRAIFTKLLRNYLSS